MTNIYIYSMCIYIYLYTYIVYIYMYICIYTYISYIKTPSFREFNQFMIIQLVGIRAGIQIHALKQGVFQ